MSMDEMGEDLNGDETDGDEAVVGALARTFRKAGFAPRAAVAAARAAAPRTISTAMLPASAVKDNAPHKIRAYCGLGTVAWTGTDDTDKTFEVEPQSPFIGERLVIVGRYSDGAVSRLVTITRPLTVGGLPQTPAPEQPAPIEMFQADCTYAALDLKLAAAGTKISLGLSIDAAPGTGESVVVAAGLYGKWIQ